MRSRKKVLLCGPDDVALGTLGYVLWVRNYGAVLAESAAGALAVLKDSDEIECAVVVGARDLDWAEQAVCTIADAAPRLPVLLLTPARCAPVTRATRFQEAADVAKVVEAVQVLCARKRGPRKEGGRYICADITKSQSNLQRVG